MGDRVLIQLECGDERSPILYLHWGGGSAAETIHRAEKRMKGRERDVSYAFARLVAAACDQNPGNLSVGVWNAPTFSAEHRNDMPSGRPLNEHDSHGDAGCIVVDITGPTWIANCSGGYYGKTIETVSDMTRRARTERKRRRRIAEFNKRQTERQTNA